MQKIIETCVEVKVLLVFEFRCRLFWVTNINAETLIQAENISLQFEELKITGGLTYVRKDLGLNAADKSCTLEDLVKLPRTQVRSESARVLEEHRILTH